MNKALDIWFRSDLRNWSCEGLEITPCSRKWWHWTCWGWCCCPFRAFNKLGILPLVPKKYTSPMGTAILGTSTNRQLLRWLIHLEVDVGLLRQQKLRPEEVPESSGWRPRSSYPMRFSWYLRISHLTCFFWGESLHLHPLPIAIFLELIDSIAPLRSRNTSSWDALLIPCWYLLQVSFGWMVCSFCRPFLLFRWCHLFASPRHCPRSRSPMISVAAFHGEFNWPAKNNWWKHSCPSIYVCAGVDDSEV